MVGEEGIIIIASTLGTFFFAALLEIGGGYLIWRWLKDHRGKMLGFVGAIVLLCYGVVMTFQPANFGKAYATYGGIFVISSIIWGFWVDKKKPDKFEIIGSAIVLIGISVMFYFPR